MGPCATFGYTAGWRSFIAELPTDVPKSCFQWQPQCLRRARYILQYRNKHLMRVS
jgi:hypothetical protein